MQILKAARPQELKQIMKDISVDPYGIKIMSPKARHYLVRMNSVSNVTANILKQELLSLGGDVAVARGSLTGRLKKTDCLIMASLSQLMRLNQKLKIQPFGLKDIARELNTALENYQKDDFVIDLGRFKLHLGRHTLIMGIVNVTPDSFSGDGIRSLSLPEQVDAVMKMASDGADIIDIGGQSSRPKARPVSLKEELSRVIPLIKALAKKIKVPISIDTTRASVAEQALDNGAVILNDICGLRNPKLAKLAKHYQAGVVIMHMQGNPMTMQDHPHYFAVVSQIIDYLGRAIEHAKDQGIDKNKIIIDPGIGFGKTVGHNLEILRHLEEFKVLGQPILVGPSRKSFIGKILDAGPKERIFGTVSACVLAASCGAKIVRVHDVRAVKQALKIAEEINNI